MEWNWFLMKCFILLEKEKKKKTSPWCALENLFNLMKLCQVGSSHLSFNKLYFFFPQNFLSFLAAASRKQFQSCRQQEEEKLSL